MQEHIEQTSLINLGKGAAVERFDHELGKVLENIMDPNTTDVKRTIKLEVTIKPVNADDRGVCSVGISCASKLAPMATYPSTMYVGKTREGDMVACEDNPLQTNLFDQPEEPDNVQPFSKEATG